MTSRVREPIQVYLTASERDELDRAAGDLGVSRSEALRRGIRALTEGRYAGDLRDLVEEGSLTPASTGPGEPPPALPVALLNDVLAGLARDREDR